MLVEVLDNSGACHAGCTVHFYNKKEVLIGNYYNFVPYHKLRMRIPKNRRFTKYGRGKKMNFFEYLYVRGLCRIIDKCIRLTEPILD